MGIDESRHFISHPLRPGGAWIAAHRYVSYMAQKGSADPEKGEPSLRLLSDRFRSVTATSHMKYAFSLYPLCK